MLGEMRYLEPGLQLKGGKQNMHHPKRIKFSTTLSVRHRPGGLLKPILKGFQNIPPPPNPPTGHSMGKTRQQ